MNAARWQEYLSSADGAVRARAKRTRAHSLILVGGDASSDQKSSEDKHSCQRAEVIQ